MPQVPGSSPVSTNHGHAPSFECRYTAAKIVAFVLLDCVMIAVGFGCTRIDSLRAQVAGWAGVVFFGAALPVIGLQAFRRGPVLVVDARGLDYRRLPIGVVPWDDVAEVWTGEVRGQRFLCVALRDETPYLARLSAARRALAGANRAMGFPLVSISLAGTDKTPDDALAAVRAFLAGRAVPSGVSADLVQG